MSDPSPEASRTLLLFRILFILLLLCGLFLRLTGLFRSLDRGYTFHPDEAKQVHKLSAYLQGRYLEYHNDLYYDGYPYGLNRLDELILRPVFALRHGIRTQLGMPEELIPPIPELYYWARSLRVLYALAIMLLLYACCRRLKLPRSCSLLAMGLYALHPLAITVSHAATGDIGTDLWVALAMYTLIAACQGGRYAWWCACGIACGWAFACKYHGALAMWMPGAALLFRSWPVWKNLSSKLLAGLSCLAGFFLGALLGNPGFVLDGKRTWRLLVKNLEFIQNYNRPPGYDELNLLGKMEWGLTRNLPGMSMHLGLILLLICISTLILYALRKPKDEETSTEETRAGSLAMCSFPLLALLLATLFKADVQPFHFSFLLPPLALAAALLFRPQLLARHKGLTAMALPFLLLQGMLWAPLLKQEQLLWASTESRAIQIHYAHAVFKDPTPILKQNHHRYPHADSTIKFTYVEPAQLPVFRNTARRVDLPNGTGWISNPALPLHSQPAQLPDTWVLMHGPRLPVSDRVFRLQSQGSPLLRRNLVFHDKLPNLRIGFRSGAFPARVVGEIDGQRIELELAAHEQQVVEFKALRGQLHFPAHHKFPASYLLPLQLRCFWSDVEMQLLDSEEALDSYLALGPGAPIELLVKLAENFPPAEVVPTELLRYAEETELEQPLPVSRNLPFLAAGSYELILNLHNSGPSAELQATLSGSLEDALPRLEIPPGSSRQIIPFRKQALPLEPLLKLESNSSGLSLHGWELKLRLDDQANTLRALAQLPGPEELRLPPSHPTRIRFAKRLEVQSLYLPETLRSGSELPYTLRVKLSSKLSTREFQELVLFLHLKDPDGNTIAHLDMPLREAAFSDEVRPHFFQVPAPLAAGSYRLNLGLYNTRTRIRYTAEGEDEDQITVYEWQHPGPTP